MPKAVDLYWFEAIALLLCIGGMVLALAQARDHQDPARFCAPHVTHGGAEHCSAEGR